MSRVGKQPVTIPTGVKVSVDGKVVSVEGPKGKLQQRIGNLVTVVLEEDSLVVSPNINSRQAKSNWGTTRSLLQNMVQGVTEGWKKSLDLVGVGFTAQLSGKDLTLLTGYSHKSVISIPDGVNCSVQKTSVELESCDKRQVGELAANIRKVCPPEPYLGKGIRYRDETVRRKAGKSGK